MTATTKILFPTILVYFLFLSFGIARSRSQDDSCGGCDRNHFCENSEGVCLECSIYCPSNEYPPCSITCPGDVIVHGKLVTTGPILIPWIGQGYVPQNQYTAAPEREVIVHGKLVTTDPTSIRQSSVPENEYTAPETFNMPTFNDTPSTISITQPPTTTATTTTAAVSANNSTVQPVSVLVFSSTTLTNPTTIGTECSNRRTVIVIVISVFTTLLVVLVVVAVGLVIYQTITGRKLLPSWCRTWAEPQRQTKGQDLSPNVGTHEEHPLQEHTTEKTFQH